MACDTSVSAAVAPPARASASTAAATRSSAEVDTGKCASPLRSMRGAVEAWADAAFAETVIIVVKKGSAIIAKAAARIRPNVPRASFTPDRRYGAIGLPHLRNATLSSDESPRCLATPRRRPCATVEDAAQAGDACVAGAWRRTGRARFEAPRDTRSARTARRRHRPRAHDDPPRGEASPAAVHRTPHARHRPGAVARCARRVDARRTARPCALRDARTL